MNLNWMQLGQPDMFGNAAAVAEVETGDQNFKTWYYAYLTPQLRGNYAIYISQRDQRLNLRSVGRQLLTALTARSALVDRIREASSLERAKDLAERLIKELLPAESRPSEPAEEPVKLLFLKGRVTYDTIPQDVYVVALPERWSRIAGDYSLMCELVGGTHSSSSFGTPVEKMSNEVDLKDDILRSIKKFGAVRVHPSWFQTNIRASAPPTKGASMSFDKQAVASELRGVAVLLSAENLPPHELSRLYHEGLFTRPNGVEVNHELRQKLEAMGVRYQPYKNKFYWFFLTKDVKRDAMKLMREYLDSLHVPTKLDWKGPARPDSSGRYKDWTR